MGTVPTTSTRSTVTTPKRRGAGAPPVAAAVRSLAWAGGYPGWTRTERLIARQIADLADDWTGVAIVADRDLAAACGLARETVVRHAGALVASGLLTRRPGHVIDGHARPTVWVVLRAAYAEAAAAVRHAWKQALAWHKQQTAERVASLGTIRHRSRSSAVTHTHTLPSGSTGPGATHAPPECRDCGRPWIAGATAPPDLICGACRDVSLTPGRPH